jgi:hypothetical protein
MKKEEDLSEGNDSGDDEPDAPKRVRKQVECIMGNFTPE